MNMEASDNPTPADNLGGGVDEKGKSPGLLVVLCGLVTTVLTLLLVYYLQTKDIQPMGFYIFAIVPVGAILVGLCAGSGYALGSWWAGAKIGGGLLIFVMILQVGAYFSAQYVDYAQTRVEFDRQTAELFERLEEATGEQLDEQDRKENEEKLREEAGINSFGTYFDRTTRSFTFDGGQELGGWGYGIRLLEIIGFALGSLIIPLILMAQPYCTKCQVYRKTRQLGLLPAGIQPRKVKKKDAEGQEALASDAEEAMQGGIQLVEETAEMAQGGQTTEFIDTMREIRDSKKEVSKLSSRIQVSLEFCPRCHDGNLLYAMVSGQGEETVTEPIASFGVSEDFVRATKLGI